MIRAPLGRLAMILSLSSRNSGQSQAMMIAWLSFKASISFDYLDLSETFLVPEIFLIIIGCNRIIRNDILDVFLASKNSVVPNEAYCGYRSSPLNDSPRMPIVFPSKLKPSSAAGRCKKLSAGAYSPSRYRRQDQSQPFLFQLVSERDLASLIKQLPPAYMLS